MKTKRQKSSLLESRHFSSISSFKNDIITRLLRAGQNWHTLVIISSATSLVKYQFYIKIPPMFAAASYVTLNSNNINML